MVQVVLLLLRYDFVGEERGRTGSGGWGGVGRARQGGERRRCDARGKGRLGASSIKRNVAFSVSLVVLSICDSRAPYIMLRAFF